MPRTPNVEIAQEVLDHLTAHHWEIGIALAEEGKRGCFGKAYSDTAQCHGCEHHDECKATFDARPILNETEAIIQIKEDIERATRNKEEGEA